MSFIPRRRPLNRHVDSRLVSIGGALSSKMGVKGRCLKLPDSRTGDEKFIQSPTFAQVSRKDLRENVYTMQSKRARAQHCQ